LLKIIAGMLSLNTGQIDIFTDLKLIKKDNLRNYLTYLAPDMLFYDELSGKENLEFFISVSGEKYINSRGQMVLERTGLGKRGEDCIKEYSSGMKMRLKYALAMYRNSPVLILDEPSTNLDQDGREIVYDFMKEQKQNGILIFATNEDNETGMADERIILGS